MEILVKSRDVAGLECWDFICECGFFSEGWPSEALATQRSSQHQEEHATGIPAPDKNDLLIDGDIDKARDLAELLERRRK